MKRKEFLSLLVAAPLVMISKPMKSGSTSTVGSSGLCCEEMEKLYGFINRLPVHSNPDGSNFRYQDMRIHTCADDTIEGRYIDSLWYWEDPETSDYPSGKNSRKEFHCFGFGFSYCPFCGHKYGGTK